MPNIKKYIAIFIAISIVLTNTNIYALYEDKSNDEIITMLKAQGYEAVVKKVSSVYFLNPYVYREQQKVVYSASSTFTDLRSSLVENQGANNRDAKGNYRYLGYNSSLTPVANGYFIPDVKPSGGHLNARKWIKHDSAIDSWKYASTDLANYMLVDNSVQTSSVVGTDSIVNLLKH